MESLMSECGHTMKDDYVEKVGFEMGLNSDQTFVGKDRALPAFGNQLLN